ncbi:MAG: methyltransferase domain-containing protein [Deltaproteobacteria bacterium]|nr:methyltransferase domain-containing protein [Deltaproteobacteria bacterium]
MVKEDIQELNSLTNLGVSSAELEGNDEQISRGLGIGLFLKAAISNPRAVGACFPSSVRVARTIAEQVQQKANEWVVEVGAGTGVITQALLEKGVNKTNFIVIERDPKLASYLRERFPQLQIINGDAAELKKYTEGLSVSTVVSGLPLLSLPKDLVKKIGQQFLEVLGHEGRLIQFTYRISKKPSPLPQGFRRVFRQKIWRNLPPARVEVYQYQN